MNPASGMFITATGTHCGKTWVTRGIAAALRAQHHPVTAIKPIETGCNPHPDDARKLAQACDRLELVSPAARSRAGGG
ncbi:MAG: dethiobiotin synthase, partial [Myxococcota bacterium]